MAVKNIISVMCTAALLASCTSEREERLINECRDEYYSRGIKDKKTGERLTPNSDVGIYLMIQDICMDKAELYADGYRVEPFVEEFDIPVFQLKGKDSLKQFHLEVLREME